ncbi:MAG: hypothetical protein Q8O42_09420 [Acidobacteriota bacterium]|nr:hypothetical protein [Acidobacteriota bacterium]
MKAPKARTSQAIKDGQAAGVWLAETAGHALLSAYSNRPTNGRMSDSSKRWLSAWDSLHAALGVMADDPKVAAALQELDGAHGDSAVEHEDRAWHAAWTLAMSLRSPRV